jgi:multidrug efflux pump subunit AcrB
VVDSAREVSVPKFLVLVCVLSAFVPSFFMTGIPGALFTPLSLAVGFAMVASYFLSQTLVPILVIKLLKPAARRRRESHFAVFQERYATFLQRLFPARRLVVTLYLLGCVAALLILSQLVSIELFPSVDTG